MTSLPLKPLAPGAHYVILSPEDIATLKQEHWEYQQALYDDRGRRSENRNWRIMFETLERILKQID